MHTFVVIIYMLIDVIVMERVKKHDEINFTS